MARCVGKYLKEGLKEYRGDNSAEKSLDTNLGDLRDFFEETLDPLPYWTTAMELIEKYEDWYKTVHAGKYMKVSYTAKTMKSKLKTYCNLKGLVYDDGNGATRKWNGESKRWIQVTNPVTKVTKTVTDGDDKDNVSVTYSADDPLFGDFAEKTEKGDEISVTVTELSPISSPIQTTENEGFVKKGDKVTEKTHSYIRKENENIYIGSCKVTSPFVTEKRIKTHKVDDAPKEVAGAEGMNAEDGGHSEKVKAWVEGLKMNGYRILDESGDVVEYERDGNTYQQEYGIFVEVPTRRTDEMPF